MRYDALKSTYEARLSSLEASVWNALGAAESDAAAVMMREDAASATFAPQRMREVALETLSEDREAFIEDLAEQLALANERIEETTKKLHKIESERQKLAKSLHAASDQAEKLRSSQNHANLLQKQLEETRQERKKMDEEVATALGVEMQTVVTRSLSQVARAVVSGLAADAQAARAKVSEAAVVIDKLETRLKDEIARREAVERNESKLRDYIQRAEEERLELREQYMAIGRKLENLATVTQSQTEEQLNRFQMKAEQAEERARHYEHLSNNLQERITDSESRSSRKDRVIGDLESDLKRLKEESETLSEKHAEMLSQEKTSWVSKNRHLEEVIEKLKRDHLHEKKSLEAESKELVHEIETRRRKHEEDRERQLNEFQAKMEENFKSLLKAKQAELDKALRAQRVEKDRRQAEDERVERAVEARLQRILRDHISMNQHRELLKSQIQAFRSEAGKNLSDAHERFHQEKDRAVAESVETVKRSEAAESRALKEQLDALKEQFANLRNVKQDLEADLESERERVAEVQAEVASLRSGKENLLQQIEKESERIQKLEHSIVEERKAHASTLDGRLNEMKQLESKFEQLRGENAHLEKAKAEMEREAFRKFNEETLELKSSFSEAQSKLTEELRAREHEVDILKMNIESMTKQQNDSKNLRDVDLKENHALREKATDLERQVDVVTQDKVKMASTLAEKKEELKRLRKRFNTLRKGLPRTKASCRATNEWLRSENREIRKVIESCSRDLLFFGNELANVVGLRFSQTLAASRESMKEFERSKELEVRHLKSSLSQMEKVMEELKRSAELELERKEGEASHRLCSELGISNARVAELEEKLASSLHSAHAAAQSLEELEAKVEERRRHIEKLDVERSSLSSQLSQIVSVICSFLPGDAVGFGNLMDARTFQTSGLPALQEALRRRSNVLSEQKAHVQKLESENERLKEQLSDRETLRTNLEATVRKCEKIEERLESANHVNEEKARHLMEQFEAEKAHLHDEFDERLEAAEERAKSERKELWECLAREKSTNKLLRQQLDDQFNHQHLASSFPPPRSSFKSFNSSTSSFKSLQELEAVLDRSKEIDSMAKRVLSTRTRRRPTTSVSIDTTQTGSIHSVHISSPSSSSSQTSKRKQNRAGSR